MDFSRAFASDAKEDEVLAAFDVGGDTQEFAKALEIATGHLWTGPTRSTGPIGRVFCVGVSRFVSVIDSMGEEIHSKSSTPSETMQIESSRGLGDSPETPPTGEFSPPEKSEFAIGGVEPEDGEDITNLSNFQRKPSFVAEETANEEIPADSVDVTESAEARPFVSAKLGTESNDNHAFYSLPDTFGDLELTFEQKVARIDHIADLLTVWFATIAKNAKKQKKDAFAEIFGPPGSEKFPNDGTLHSLLSRTKTFIEKVIESNDLDRASTLRKLIIMMYETLHALFVNLSLEAGAASSNSAIVVKSLLYCFFQVDFAEIFQSLLDRATGHEFLELTPRSRSLKELGTSSESQRPELRLSYEAVMKIYTVYLSLANCPIELILIDKVSLSLDITTPEDTSPNVYTRHIESLDFLGNGLVDNVNNRLIAQLAAIFNYFYDLSPDILRHSLRHSSFFGWITGNTLSSGSYLSTDTTSDVTSFADITLDPVDPFLYEVELYEHKKRIKHAKNKPDSTLSVQCPSYLVLTFQILQLLRNREFTLQLVSDTDQSVALLDIWLCVSSYVHHYQYKSTINTFGARVSLFLLLKMTSPKGSIVGALRERKIDENKWKLCHHKHPVIPLDENSPQKDALLYIVDVLQVTFRYNLSRKLDLENTKMALTVLYQVLLDFEAHPTDGLRTYAWSEFYAALVNFIKFVDRSQNEEGVKYVIEEFFSIMQLLLSPAFNKVIEKSSDFFSLGYHPAKSMKYDLLYVMLQQRETLEMLFGKYIQKRRNFYRVEKAFLDLKEMLSKYSNSEIHHDDVTRILNQLTLSGEEDSQAAPVNQDGFGYAETFKYLDKEKDYEHFDKQSELVRVFVSIYEADWVGDGVRKK